MTMLLQLRLMPLGLPTHDGSLQPWVSHYRDRDTNGMGCQGQTIRLDLLMAATDYTAVRGSLIELQVDYRYRGHLAFASISRCYATPEVQPCFRIYPDLPT
jgi:hypothetical protein